MVPDKAARLAAIRAANAAKRPTAERVTGDVLSTASTAQSAALPATDSLVEPLPADVIPIRARVLLGALVGVVIAVLALRVWLPELSASLSGTQPKAYWYLARSSGLVAYALLWFAMILGLLMTSRFARVWPGGPTALELHQHTSLLGLACAIFHTLILLGDRYVQSTLAQVLLPFAYAGFAPLWVGLGQLALYGLALVSLSFSVKARLGRRLWRLVHGLSFVVFALALAHGISSGTDSGTVLARVAYWASGGSVLFLTVYRAGAAVAGKPIPAPQHAASRSIDS